MAPDIAVLQEVGAIDHALLHEYKLIIRHPISRTGNPQRFNTAILVRGIIVEEIPLWSTRNWVQDELLHFNGNLFAYKVRTHSDISINAVAVYSPPWPVNPNRLMNIDTTPIKLKLNTKVWVADLLHDALSHMSMKPEEKWLIAGDFNLSETFDSWRGGPRGNREFLDRMKNLGLTECLRQSAGELTPTFRNPRGGLITAQIDYLWTTKSLVDCLESCATGDVATVFGQSLSDHLPIVADFKFT